MNLQKNSPVEMPSKFIVISFVRLDLAHFSQDRTSEMLEIYGLGFVFASLLGLLSGVFMISTQA
jgi:hypothetical protein